MDYRITVVVVTIILMVFLLVRDYLRPGIILFSAVVVFLIFGILTPAEALAGFSNKGMITVALLFLISEGIRRSDTLKPITQRIFPQKGYSVKRGYAAILPIVAGISAFMNNTPIVVIFLPHIKAWCRRVSLPLKKFLIPLSYAAILGGTCTLIGTSTNLVVHGLMLDAGLSGLTMFEIGKVGVIIAVVALLYLIFFADKMLPSDSETGSAGENHIVEVVLAARFPGIRCKATEFDFRKHYGADIIAVRRDGVKLEELEGYEFKENDTLVLATNDSSFVDTWGESRVFLVITNGRQHEGSVERWKRVLSLLLLIIMVAGATLSQVPAIRELFGQTTPDMFFWAAIVTVTMAACNIFPAKKYTKFISWDILITIASALAISRAMINSGAADALAAAIISLTADASPYAVLAAIYITTNIITEIITNNAAAAFAFPIGLSAASQLGVSAAPFCIAICIAASASFASPIGYQTNMIVQGLGGYKFRDFLRIGLPLNIIAFVISMIFIPIFWNF